MPAVRYQVDEVPESAWAEAFFPTPGLTPAGQFSLRRFITGAPGTARVASPAPAGRGRLSTNPEWQPPSAAAPDWFAPQIWVNDISQLHVGATPSGGGVSYMPRPVAQPVPPIVPIAGPAPVAMTGRKVGGRRSMFWPRNIVRWPNLSGRYE